MILFKNTILVPKIIFPVISKKDQLRKILNVNQWDKFNESLLYKLELASEIFFNRYIYYHLKDINPYIREIFCCACKYGNDEIIQLMIEKGANNWIGGLIQACGGNHLSIINLIIEKIENELSTLPICLRDKNGVNYWNRGLLYACDGGHLSIVQLMIGKGANNLDDGLIYACGGGHLSIVQLMINKGADDWDSGLFYACNRGHLSIVQLMINKGAVNWYDGLKEACKGGHLSIVQLLIENIDSEFSALFSVERNKRAESFNCGLIYACKGGHLLIVQLLVEKGADNWNMGLEIANSKMHLEIINYLSKLLKIEY